MSDVEAWSPPSNVAAEFAILGALMFAPEVASAHLLELRETDFFDPFLGFTFTHAQALAREHGSIPAEVLHSRLTDAPGYEEKLGGYRFLADLIDRAPPPSTLPAYVAEVANAARLRRLFTLTSDVAVRATQPAADAFQLVAETEREIGALLQDAAPAGANLIDAHASAAVTVARLEDEAAHGRPKGAMTGLRCFDRRMRGLRPGWLVVLAGRPSMGKTALARVAAIGCARRSPQKRVLFFALEMGREELDERTLSQITREMGDGIAYKDMTGDALPPEDRAEVAAAAMRVPANLLIDDSPVLSVDYVRRRVLAERRKGPIAAVFIDYLQIMDRPDPGRRTDAAILGEITKALKQLAREAGCCVVLLSQINRGVESRDDKRPLLSDLRESGSIEQDANAVSFVYREAYYLERSPPKRGAAADKVQEWDMACHDARHRLDVICAKCRGGAIGVDEQHYEPAFDLVDDVQERPR